MPPKKFGDHDPFPLDPDYSSNASQTIPKSRSALTTSYRGFGTKSEIEKKIAEGIRRKFSSFRQRKNRMESIFNDKHDKVREFNLPADSAAMTYLACLKTEFSGLNLDVEQVSYVFQNTVIINFLQITLVMFIWVHAFNI
jgi:predicted oxidoreductase (fatty acid repression mutant protein)